jgi:helix-turn-helix protein
VGVRPAGELPGDGGSAMNAAVVNEAPAARAQWISVADAAERLSATPGRVYHLITDGRLATKTIRGRVHVRVTDVSAYREYQRVLQNGKGRRALLYPKRERGGVPGDSTQRVRARPPASEGA